MGNISQLQLCSYFRYSTGAFVALRVFLERKWYLSKPTGSYYGELALIRESYANTWQMLRGIYRVDNLTSPVDSNSSH